MKQKQFFLPILYNAWLMTWKNKLSWLAGLFALFLSGVLGFQVIVQGITGLAQPTFWWARWKAWASGMSPIDFFSGQWNILTTDTTGWLVMFLVWAAILIGLLVLAILSIYSITVIISAAKIKFVSKRDDFLLALREAFFHFKSVFWAVVLTQIASSVLVILFSIPVIWLGVNNTSILKLILLLLFFFVFLAVAYSIAMIALYTVMHIVVEDYTLSAAVVGAWNIFKQYWFITLEMFVIQLVIAAAVAILTVIVVGLFAIPIIIIGLIMVSNQMYDISAFLPKLVLYLSIFIMVAVASAYTVFQLLSWSFMFMNIEKIRPHSRFVEFIEMQILSS